MIFGVFVFDPEPHVDEDHVDPVFLPPSLHLRPDLLHDHVSLGMGVRERRRKENHQFRLGNYRLGLGQVGEGELAS